MNLPIKLEPHIIPLKKLIPFIDHETLQEIQYPLFQFCFSELYSKENKDPNLSFYFSYQSYYPIYNMKTSQGDIYSIYIKSERVFKNRKKAPTCIIHGTDEYEKFTLNCIYLKNLLWDYTLNKLR